MNKIKRLLKSVAWKLFKYTDFMIKNADGNIIPLRQKGDFDSFREIYILNEYDKIFDFLKNITSWIDIGCNIGLFSLALSEKILLDKTECKAMLIDANPDCISRVKEIAKINNINSWDIIHSILGINDQKTIFYQSKSSSRSTIFKPESRERGIAMKSTSLSNLIKDAKYDLIKIDIEGAESILFEYEGELLAQFKYGIVEWHAPHHTGRDIEKWVYNHNLKILHIQNPVKTGKHLLDERMGVLLWSKN
jgi:FkbM family methyltransferase